MDYKYIECLIERYFECDTTSQEERILRDFFMQDSVPAHLAQYKPLFETLAIESELTLPADFDTKFSQRIKALETQAVKPTLRLRLSRLNLALRPMFKAVASVALIVTVGVASSKYWNSQDTDPVEYNYAKYHDTYSDPQMAYDQVSKALQDVSEAFKNTDLATADSMSVEVPAITD